MTPSSSCASVDEVGQALEGEGSDGHEPRGGNGARRRAVSLDGVPLRLDGEACWASSGTVSGADGTRLKTLSFGPETGKTTALLAAEVARKVRPDLKLVAAAAPDNWTFLERLRPDEQAVDFFHACEHLGEVADRRDRLVRPRRATPPAASTRSAIRYLRDKAMTKTATAVLERELRFFRRHRRRMRYASLKAGGYGSAVVRQQGAGQPAAIPAKGPTFAEGASRQHRCQRASRRDPPRPAWRRHCLDYSVSPEEPAPAYPVTTMVVGIPTACPNAIIL